MFTEFSFKRQVRALKSYLSRNENLILTYHGIFPDGEDFFSLDYHMKRSEFFVQMKHLVESGYRCVTLGELVDNLGSGCIQKKTVAITFDDGFYNNYSQAYPILKQFGIPATIFVATGYVGSGRLNWPELNLLLVKLCKSDCLHVGEKAYSVCSDEDRARVYNQIEEFRKSMESEQFELRFDRLLVEAGLSREEVLESKHAKALSYLEWGHIQEMASSGLIEIGSHSVLHRRLNRLAIEDARWEMQHSAQEIKDHVGVCRYFAYPYGDYSGIHENMAQELGYSAVFTATQAGVIKRSSVYRMPRYLVVTKGVDSFDYFLRGGLSMLGVKSKFDIIKALFSGSLSRPLPPRPWVP